MADLLTPQQIEHPVPPQEQVPAERVEVGAEGGAEQQVERREAPESAASQERVAERTVAPSAAVSTSARPSSEVPMKDEISRGVEKILEADLGELYASLDPAAKEKFRERGETVAKEISTMVRTLKVRVSHVLRLIRDWLLMIPKVNKHFLEQEAKIKTDEILAFSQEQKEQPPTET